MKQLLASSFLFLIFILFHFLKRTYDTHREEIYRLESEKNRLLREQKEHYESCLDAANERVYSQSAELLRQANRNRLGLMNNNQAAVVEKFTDKNSKAKIHKQVQLSLHDPITNELLDVVKCECETIYRRDVYETLISKNGCDTCKNQIKK